MKRFSFTLLSAFLTFVLCLLAMSSLRAQSSASSPEPFVPTAIPAAVKARMEALRPASGAVAWTELRYLPLLHYTAAGEVKRGEMVVNRTIAADVAEIFRKLYEMKYSIERIALMEDYGGDDERSMRANNTSAYCHRAVKGARTLSKHAEGRAVDLNPLYNPCFAVVRNARGDSIGFRQLQPATAVDYVDRRRAFRYKLDAKDPAVRLFKQKGFRWGGDWRRKKDYQHFER